jgi:hypothetical protein
MFEKILRRKPTPVEMIPDQSAQELSSAERGKREQQEKLLKLLHTSEPAFRLYHDLQDPTLSREEFFSKALSYSSDLRPEGLCVELNAADGENTLLEGRRVQVRLFNNGCITFSVGDTSVDPPAHRS